MPSRAYVLGLLVAGAGLGVSEFVDGLYDDARSPVVAVAESFIERTPGWLKDWAISTFGTNDKLALVVGTLIVITLVGLGVGVLTARGRIVAAGAVTVAMSAVGGWAVITSPNAGWRALGPTVAGLAASLAVLGWYRTRVVDSPSATDVAPLDRRRFLYGGASIGALALAGVGGGRLLGRRFGVASEREELALRVPDDPGDALQSIEPAVDLGLEGLTPFVTPNANFYRIDTAILSPQVHAGDWRLRIHGMVERELELTFDELLDREQIERYVTLSCVSNEVGGDLVGNALWQGALLAPLLEEAGIDPRAEQLVSRSHDGWTCGTPLAEVTDGRDALLAVKMNGEPLPIDHGYPVRMVVPGLYGYVSATKWVVDLELTTWDAFDAFWVPRGWDQQAPFKMTSRIDTPRGGASLRAGEVVVAGVAWHPHVGIGVVEVQVDDGRWRPAELAGVPTYDTWRQWSFRWDAAPGAHTLRVRATNEAGGVQTSVEARPDPNGSSGLHGIDVDVS